MIKEFILVIKESFEEELEDLSKAQLEPFFNHIQSPHGSIIMISLSRN